MADTINRVADKLGRGFWTKIPMVMKEKVLSMPQNKDKAAMIVVLLLTSWGEGSYTMSM